MGKATSKTAEPDHIATTQRLLTLLLDLRGKIAAEGEATLATWEPLIRREEFLPSARNLANYLAFRKIDMRELQGDLSALGLSSLGRCESQVLASIDALLASLTRIAGLGGHPYPTHAEFSAGRTLLSERQASIFGLDPGGPSTRIMVTLPTEAADDPQLIRSYILAGADCVRINCAHDSAEVWGRMIAITRASATDLKRDVRVAMDIAGPKLRIAKVSTDEKIRLTKGDRFVLTDQLSGKSKVIEATLSHPELLEHVTDGMDVWINDGKIGAKLTERVGNRLEFTIFSAREKGERLKPEKGVNFPGMDIPVAALTPEDVTNLDFVVEHADMIGFSFVQTPEDVRQLAKEVAARCKAKALPAVMLKIETPLAVRNLPRLIVQAGAVMPVTVMIARGDLAVEIGLERLSEMQEEILWLCEAAHVPVVWATQVLEGLVSEGKASRAEVTDAAMSQRAECVMLNKGPHLAEAVEFLDRVLRRMDRHQLKKTAQLGPLMSWQDKQALS
jgi:pyruvate kinase